MNNTVVTMKKTKSIKIFFIVPLFALALTGCKKADDVPNALEEMAKHQNTIEAMASQINLPSNSAKAQQKQTTQPSLPTPEILGFPYPAFAEPYVQALSSQKELPTSEQIAVVSQLAEKETTTFYFGKNYQLMSSPQNNGYYRKILGKNKNGQIVAQDYYQDTQTPQTAPFAFTASGNIRSFDSKGNIDSIIISFGKNGNLETATNYKNGVAISPAAIYQNNKLIAQSKADNPFSIAVYYEDGRTVAAIYDFLDKEMKTGRVVFFRNDGSPISVLNMVDGSSIGAVLWDKNGVVTDGKLFPEESKPVNKRVGEVLTIVGQLR